MGEIQSDTFVVDAVVNAIVLLYLLTTPPFINANYGEVKRIMGSPAIATISSCASINIAVGHIQELDECAGDFTGVTYWMRRHSISPRNHQIMNTELIAESRY